MSLAYLGWQGRGNFGDDALYEFWRLSLGSDALPQVPLYRDEWQQWLATYARSLRFPRPGGVLIGGGTVLGYTNWARHVRRAVSATRSRSVIFAGAGASLKGSSDNNGQMVDFDAWNFRVPLHALGCRGPLSAETIKGAFGDVPVIGDPVLALPPLLGVVRNEERELAVSLGFNANHRPLLQVSVSEVVDAIENMRPAGEVAVVTLSVEDKAVNARLVEALHSRGIQSSHFSGSVKEIVQTLANSRFVLSQRLHGLVAGAAAGSLPIAVPYESKVLDFMSSVRADDLVAGEGPDSLVDVLDRARRFDGTVVANSVGMLTGQLRVVVEKVRAIAGE